MARPVSFPPSGNASIIKRPTHGTPQPLKNTAAFNVSGNGAASISSEKGSSPRSTVDSDVRQIIWEFWRVGGRQAEFRYRGTPNVIDLGEL
jgi:hypothetical protein